MLKIRLGKIFNINDYDELARMFLPRGMYELVWEKADVFEGVPEKLAKARAMYEALSAETGRTLPWGVLTGVKPVKLFSQLAGAESVESAEKKLTNDYLVSVEKVSLMRRVYERQSETPDGTVAVYIGIPFCPTRCSYCTFTSGVGTEKQMREYLDVLYCELDYVSKRMREAGLFPESVYIGGGTPTALPLSMFDELLGRVKGGLYMEGAEFTVEAGRPDTITYEKASIMAKAGARVSVNPQTMNDETLRLIGRDHTAADSKEAFETVRAAGVKLVNADIIAGLPGEGAGDFRHTLEETVKTGAENITIHTLALKKGSALLEKNGTEQYYSNFAGAAVMLREADAVLSGKGMFPYYLYRQKQTVGNLENTGYAALGAECVYNMRMMQEKQTVIALGAGAVSKLYFPEEDRIERVFNVADNGLYIERAQEMIERKRAIFEGI